MVYKAATIPEGTPEGCSEKLADSVLSFDNSMMEVAWGAYSKSL